MSAIQIGRCRLLTFPSVCSGVRTASSPLNPLEGFHYNGAGLPDQPLKAVDEGSHRLVTIQVLAPHLLVGGVLRPLAVASSGGGGVGADDRKRRRCRVAI